MAPSVSPCQPRSDPAPLAVPGDPSWASHLLTRGPQGGLQGVRVFGSNSLGPAPPTPGPHLSPVLFVPVLGHPSWGPCHCPGLRSTLCHCGPLSCLLGHRPGLPRQGTRGLTCPGRGGGPWPRARSAPGKGPGGDVRQRRGRGACSRAQSVTDGRSALFPLLRGPAALARGRQVTAARLGVCVRGGVSRFWVPGGCGLPAELRFVCLHGNKPRCPGHRQPVCPPLGQSGTALAWPQPAGRRHRPESRQGPSAFHPGVPVRCWRELAGSPTGGAQRPEGPAFPTKPACEREGPAQKQRETEPDRAWGSPQVTPCEPLDPATPALHPAAPAS